MTRTKVLGILLVVSIIVAAVHQWVASAPTWYLYHRDFGEIRSVEEFDSLMDDVEVDVAQNFNVYRIDSSQARDRVANELGVVEYDDYGQFGYIESFDVDAWAWVWEGSGMSPDWEVVDRWRDTQRSFDYALPETKEVQFCMMGFSPAPLSGG